MMQVEQLALLTCNGSVIPLQNCQRFRIADCKPWCTAFGPLDGSRCAGCQKRIPIMVIDNPPQETAPADPRRIRGLGDLVEACIRVLFLGRLDIAHRLAARVERLIPSRRRPVPQQGKAGGCGCKARKEALNRAIPFGTTNANRLHQHDGFPAGSPGQDHLHGQGSAEPAGKHPHEH